MQLPNFTCRALKDVKRKSSRVNKRYVRNYNSIRILLIIIVTLFNCSNDLPYQTTVKSQKQYHKQSKKQEVMHFNPVQVISILAKVTRIWQGSLNHAYSYMESLGFWSRPCHISSSFDEYRKSVQTNSNETGISRRQASDIAHHPKHGQVLLLSMLSLLEYGKIWGSYGRSSCLIMTKQDRFEYRAFQKHIEHCRANGGKSAPKISVNVSDWSRWCKMPREYGVTSRCLCWVFRSVSLFIQLGM